VMFYRQKVNSRAPNQVQQDIFINCKLPEVVPLPQHALQSVQEKLSIP